MRVNDRLRCVAAALDHTLLDDLLLLQVLVDVQESLRQVNLLLGSLNRRAQLELLLILLFILRCRRWFFFIAVFIVYGNLDGRLTIWCRARGRR